ncbi:MAG: phosphotransferase, partial [Acidobacteria bacterium]|nr:phosphotransferase [Acidobacteriota bacterium]
MTDIPVVVHHAPRFDQVEAAKLTRRLFGIEGTLHPLASERDQNFLVTVGTGARFVLKIANATETLEILDFQNKAIEHLAAHSRRLALPRVVPAITGELISRVDGPGRQSHYVRMLTWVPGVALAGVTPHSDALLRSLGRRLGEMDCAFSGFSHPAASRVFAWDIRQLGWVREELPHITDPGKRAALARCLDRFDAEVAPRLADLRASVIHNDWNDHNVLVSLPATSDREVVGAVDFGDMVHSPVVADLAVAASYAMLDKPDPIAAAAAIVGGYHETLPVTDVELSVLYDCICARLCLSIAMAARQTAAAPGNEYLQISQRQVWALLQQLLAIPPQWAQYVFRGACGLPPCPSGATVARWITEHRDGFTRVLDHDLTTVATTVLDLSVGSLDIPRLENVHDVKAFTRLVFEQMSREGAAVGIGRYDEVRLAYTSPLFERPGNNG